MGLHALGRPDAALAGPERPAEYALAGVRHEVQGNTIIVSLPAKVHDKVTSSKFQVEMPPNARLAGLIRKEGDESEKPLVPFVFVEVAQPPTRRPATFPSYTPSCRRAITSSAGTSSTPCASYLLVTPLALMRRSLRFHVTWNKPNANADTEVGD